MSIEKLLADLTAALDRNTAAVSGAAVTPIKPTRASKAVEAAQAAQAPAAPAAPTPAPSPAPAPAPAAVSGVTLQTLGDLVTKLAKTDRAGVVATLGKFGVAKASLLKPEQFDDAYAAFQALEASKSATNDLV